MIRIDEIYNNTFWPWLTKNRPGYRLFFCEPFGRSDPDSVMNYGRDDVHEHNYIFLFDQEPIHLNIHQETFSRVWGSNTDITHPGQDRQSIHRLNRTRPAGYLITSEKDSYDVEQMCRQYRWKSLYYFFHGWAALDWYRGYDKTYLMPDPQDRTISHTFIAPNRIVAGMRQHRLQIMYWLSRLNLLHNHVSFPAVCPAENVSVIDAVAGLTGIYPDIQNEMSKLRLPIQFAGETDSPMHSCWLSLFDQSAQSLLYLVTETVATGKRHHITEKTFKPICLRMPFVLVATHGSLSYLRSYGFKTFGEFWDESYDQETDDVVRIEKVAGLLAKLDSMSQLQKQRMYQDMLPVLEHNYNHFYGGGFEQILWQELNDMLASIEV